MLRRLRFLPWIGVRYRIGFLGALGVVGVLLVGGMYLAGHEAEKRLQAQADLASLLDSHLSRDLADLREARAAETGYALKAVETSAAVHELAVQRVNRSLEELSHSAALGATPQRIVQTMVGGVAAYAARADEAIRANRTVGQLDGDGDGVRALAWTSGRAVRSAVIATDLPGLVESSLRVSNAHQSFSMNTDRPHADALLAELEAFEQTVVQMQEPLNQASSPVAVLAVTYRNDVRAYIDAGLAAASAMSQSEAAFEEAWAAGTAGQALAAAAAHAKQVEVAAVRDQTDQRTRMTIAGAALAVAALALSVGRSIALPLSRVAQITRRLTSGDRDVQFPYLRRRDEIGEVARALAAFGDTLAANEVASERIHHLAHFDALTGLANRAQFEDRVSQAIEKHRRGGEAFAVHCLNLDGFKAINDLHGHGAGDLLLREIASRLSAWTRKGDAAARLGGDEFIVIQCDVAGPNDALPFAKKLTSLVSQPFRLSTNVEVSVTTSIGISLFPHDGRDPDTLIRNADTALHRAKWAGKNVETLFAPEMDRNLREQRALEADLRLALERGEFTLVWQPIASANDINEIAGYEVLLRWRHPVRGMIPPDVFIPIAEACGAISAIGEWVLHTACAEAADWAEARWIAVNVSPVQVQQGEVFAQVVEAVLGETGLAPSRLTLEVTESVLIREVDRVLTTLRRIKASGVRIALDDFGTGYSSLATLRSFPFDKLKVDRSFIAGMSDNEHDAAIVRAVVGLAAGLGLPVVAEGVEVAQQLAQLVEAGCAEVQGWLIGRPGTTEHLPRGERIGQPRQGLMHARSVNDDPVQVQPAAA